MNIQSAATTTPLPAANLPSAKAVTKNVKAACDFEALLLTPVLDALQKTFGGDDDAKTTGASDYRALGTQALAQAMAARGGIGIAKLILSHLQPAPLKLGQSEPPKVSGVE
ncbi:MAG: rod-binding protein [Terriglobales bacterium]|jgi:Rod binding domain-containing protein